MKKTKNKPKQQDKTAQYKAIALLVLGLGILYIIYVNFFTIVLALSISSILIIIALIVGAYFILPLLGVEVIAALVAGFTTLMGLRKKGG